MSNDRPIDFDAAEEFMRQARAADQSGDAGLCLAARKMVSIALGLGLSPNGKIHTGHLTVGASADQPLAAPTAPSAF